MFIVLIEMTTFLLVRGQVSETTFQSMNPKEVLTKLFEATTINERNLAAWRPNFAERMNFKVSKNGYCYTELDTVITFNANGEKAVLIFKTYSTEDYKSCDTCELNLSLALFEKKGMGWIVSAFNKNINKYAFRGVISDFRLVKIHVLDIYDLAFSVDFNSKLIQYRDLYLYNVYNADYKDISRSFSSITLYTNKEKADKSKHYSYNTNVKFIPTNSWYIMELTTKGTHIDFNGQRVLPFNNKRTFHFDQSFMAYVEKNP